VCRFGTAIENGEDENNTIAINILKKLRAMAYKKS